MFAFLQPSFGAGSSSDGGNSKTDYEKAVKFVEQGKKYDEKGKRINLWDGLAGLDIGSCNEVEPQEVKDRLAYIQALEAVRAYEEQILLNIEEGDVGAILGWGCLIWAGGPFSWLDMVGHEKVSEDCSKLEKKFGVRFKLPNIIKKLASEKSSFYSEKVS